MKIHKNSIHILIIYVELGSCKYCANESYHSSFADNFRCKVGVVGDRAGSQEEFAKIIRVAWLGYHVSMYLMQVFSQ